MKDFSLDANPAGPPSTGRTVLECSFDPDAIVLGVVEALATAAGVDALEFEPRLHDVVDPEALERIVASGDSGTRVSFGLGQYHVTVDGTGEIVVCDA